jgi:hypothetical protein
MADLFAVTVAVLLAVSIVIAYLLVLHELRRINANLEQFINLIVDLRGNGPANDEGVVAAPTRSYPHSGFDTR